MGERNLISVATRFAGYGIDGNEISFSPTISDINNGSIQGEATWKWQFTRKGLVKSEVFGVENYFPKYF
jgi:hypothetical protein